MTELTPLMKGVLDALDSLQKMGKDPATPNEIAIEMGLRCDVRRHGSGAAARGGWSGYMAPSQRIIFPLNALRRRGLVDYTTRRDGLSGTAYYRL